MRQLARSPYPVQSIINVDLESKEQENITIIVSDIVGNAVIDQSINVVKGNQQLPLDVHLLSSGNYVLTLRNNRINSSATFIKKE